MLLLVLMKSGVALGVVVLLGALTGCAFDSPSIEGGIIGGRPATEEEGVEAPAASTPAQPGSSTTNSTLPDREPPSTDSPAPAQAPAAAACDRSKPFGSPVAVAGLGDEHSATPRLSADERTIFFTGNVGGIARLRFATRASLDAPFAPPQALDALSSPAKDNDPSVSADGKTIFFSSERNGSDDVFTATRASTDVPFTGPKPLAIVNTTSDDGHPYFRQSANELWFSSSRAGAWEIYVSRPGANGGLGAPARVTELSGGKTQQPMITEDGLTIIFSSDRAGGRGGRDIWQATRVTPNGIFGKPTPIDEINSAASESAGWLSADGCRIYFSSNRGHEDHQSIFRATRPR